MVKTVWHWHTGRQNITNRKSRKRGKYMWKLRTIAERHFKSVGEITIVQKIMLRPFANHLKEIRLDPFLLPYTKINSRWSINVNIKL